MKKVAFGLVLLGGSLVVTARAAEPTAGHAMSGEAAEQSTCGQMVAGMSSIPAKLAEGAESVAEMWEAHAALMGKDKDSQAEAKGLRALAKEHKAIAASLKKASENMKKAASWPAAPHDMQKMMSDPKLTAASQKLIAIRKELVAMFQKSIADMEAMQKAK
ncbi:MAG: hypothetical protein ABSB49_01665 [Polyangia bacterium]|jgi:hypothetical protein